MNMNKLRSQALASFDNQGSFFFPLMENLYNYSVNKISSNWSFN